MWSRPKWTCRACRRRGRRSCAGRGTAARVDDQHRQPLGPSSGHDRRQRTGLRAALPRVEVDAAHAAGGAAGGEHLEDLVVGDGAELVGLEQPDRQPRHVRDALERPARTVRTTASRIRAYGAQALAVVRVSSRRRAREHPRLLGRGDRVRRRGEEVLKRIAPARRSRPCRGSSGSASTSRTSHVRRARRKRPRVGRAAAGERVGRGAR